MLYQCNVCQHACILELWAERLESHNIAIIPVLVVCYSMGWMVGCVLYLCCVWVCACIHEWCSQRALHESSTIPIAIVWACMNVCMRVCVVSVHVLKCFTTCCRV
jgi:hypothetical protein